MAIITENVDWADGSSGGTPLSAANLDNFRLNLFTEFNGSIDNANIKAAAGIVLTKLASGSSGQIIVCNGSGVPTYVTMSGDATIDNAGAVTVTAAAATTSMDDAYNNGSAVTVDNDVIAFTVTNTSNNLCLTCTQNDTTNNPVNVSMVNAGTGNDLFLDQNGNGVALYIDSEATSVAALDIEGNTFTTGAIINIDNANALTTGSIAQLLSNSSSTGTRDLVYILNDNVSATGTTLLRLKQDSTSGALAINCTANAPHFNLTGDPSPASPTDGDIWFTGSALNFRNGTTTVNIAPAYDSGWKPDSGGLANGTLLTLAHGLGSVPSRIELYGKGSLVGGNANGGDPATFLISPGYNSNQNGTSVNWDDTNVYVAWVTGAAWIIDTGGTLRVVTNASTDLQFRVFAWK